ncbi:hypothetical protein L2E82_12472 [Cichorium intybus]|uniref:Uncharacterized protein n=1 Tax=Cichorium intybus TaxID=13427 RepID=A0ACB9GH79_CICIN|nr:hypothetical protein L2E82_12472 [Cichorium intybus]
MDKMVGFLKSKQGSLVNIRELVFASTVNILEFVSTNRQRRKDQQLRFPFLPPSQQVLAGFAIVLCSSGGGRMVVPAGRSTPEMKASSNNPKKVKIAQETIKLVDEG